jgi:dihydroorotase
MFDLVISGGTVVGSEGSSAGTIGIADGTIKAVAGPHEPLQGAQLIDAGGKYILPGLVDAHSHIPGFFLSTRLDDFDSATRAAAAGGVTTVMLMPTEDPRTSTPDYFQLKKEIGEKKSHVDFAIQALVGPRSESIEEMAGMGAVSFELFLAYGGNPDFVIGNDDFELQRVMKMVRDVGGIAGVTPHSPSLVQRLTKDAKEEVEHPTVDTFAATRPPLSELLGISRALTAAHFTGTQVHMRALSTRSSVQIVAKFKELVRVSSEVMSHHLLFTDEDARRFGPYGVIVPPLRPEKERRYLREAVRSGDIDMVVSDHSPCLREDKERAHENIWIAPPGMPGYQTLCASMLALIDENELTLQHLVRHCAERPARLFNLYPKKGAIVPGADADLVIIDPSRRMEVRDSDQYSKAGYTTLAGRTVSCLIEQVLLRGRVISREGKSDGTPGGRFVRP